MHPAIFVAFGMSLSLILFNYKNKMEIIENLSKESEGLLLFSYVISNIFCFINLKKKNNQFLEALTVTFIYFYHSVLNLFESLFKYTRNLYKFGFELWLSKI